MKIMRWDGFGVFLLGLAAVIAVVAGVFNKFWSHPVAVSCSSEPCLDGRDLLAQHSMANAAWAMVGLTAVTVVIGALSLVFIILALKAARTSADAAVQAVTTAREVGQPQVRAYISVIGAELEVPSGDNAKPFLRFIIRNSGQSPTKGMYINVKAKFVSGPALETFTFNLMGAVADIASQDVDLLIWHLGSKDALIRARRLRVTGTLKYKDVFGNPDEAPVDFVTEAKEIGYGGPYKMLRRLDFGRSQI